MQKRKIRNDDEWLGLITQCRTSGLSDKAWCESRGIGTSTFYYAVRRLQRKACQIPRHETLQQQPVQEVVPLDFHQVGSVPGYNNDNDISCDTIVLRINCRSFSLDITNNASGSVIRETIASLLALC